MNNTETYTVALAGADVAMTMPQIASAYSAGVIRDTTLLWREGMDDWATLANLAGELGITTTRTSAPLRPPSVPGLPAWARQPAPAQEAPPVQSSRKSPEGLNVFRKVGAWIRMKFFERRSASPRNQ